MVNSEHKEELRSMRYDDAMGRLQQILQEIDNSQVGIDDLAERVKEASALIKLCRELLTGTEKSVEEVLKSLDEEG